MARVLGLGIVGLGRAGSIHFNNVIRNPRVDLKYLVEEQVNVAEGLVQDYRLTDIKSLHSKNIDVMLSDSSVKACVIASPTDFHESLVMRCLDAGKAVLCEKPLAKTLQAVEKCYDKAEKLNLPLICSFNRRFDPGLMYMYKRIRSGEVGKIQMVKCTSRDHQLAPMEYYRTSGGIYHDSAVHTIDLTCWLFGEKPKSVYACGHSFIKEIGEMNDVDTTTIVLKFPSGGIGVIDMSRFACYGYDNRMEVFANKGMLVQHNCKPTSVEFSGVHGAMTDPIFDSFFTRYPESFVNVMNHFLSVVEGKEEASITRDSTVMVTKVATACGKSLTTGQVVDLN